MQVFKVETDSCGRENGFPPEISTPDPVLKEKVILRPVNMVRKTIQDYHKGGQDYSNRGRRQGSTLNTARARGALEPMDRVGGQWMEITKRGTSRVGGERGGFLLN